MRRRLWLGSLLSILLVLATLGLASGSTYSEANAAYQRSEFKEAIAGYEAIVTEGVVHEDLYYNLANAYFRAGVLGKAIFNYERALRVHPGMEDAEYNLAVARDIVAGQAESRLKGAEVDAWWVRLATYFSLTELAVSLLIFNFALFAMLTALFFLPTGFVRTSLRVLVAFVALGFASSGGLLALHHYVVDNVHQGIVTSDLVVMREGPDPELAERGQLHPGLRVRILGEEHDWLLIRLANGVEGWVPAGAVGRF